MTETVPQPAEGLRQHLAEAMAKEAGSLAFRKAGTEWEHPRSVWLAHADAAVNALHRWEQQQAEPPLLDTAENSAWHSVWLHGKWTWLTKCMTTEEREYAAQCVDQYDRYLAVVDGEPNRPGLDGLRWWREAGR